MAVVAVMAVKAVNSRQKQTSKNKQASKQANRQENKQTKVMMMLYNIVSSSK